MKHYIITIVNPNINIYEVFKLDENQLINTIINKLGNESFNRIKEKIIDKPINKVVCLAGHTKYDDNNNYLIYSILSCIDNPNIDKNIYMPDIID